MSIEYANLSKGKQCMMELISLLENLADNFRLMPAAAYCLDIGTEGASVGTEDGKQKREPRPRTEAVGRFGASVPGGQSVRNRGGTEPNRTEHYSGY